MEFKDRIKRLRTENQLTQAQLAHLFGKGDAAVRAWESGKAKPDADTLCQLANYFHCTIDYLVGRSNYRSESEETVRPEIENNLLQLIQELEAKTGNSYLKWLVDFLQLVMNHNQEFIATSYLMIANFFYFALNEVYQLEEDFEKTQTFNLSKFLDCYSRMRQTTIIAKSNIQLMSSYPLPWITGCAQKYGTKEEFEAAKNFFSAYHNGGLESISS